MTRGRSRRKRKPRRRPLQAARIRASLKRLRIVTDLLLREVENWRNRMLELERSVLEDLTVLDVEAEALEAAGGR